MHSQEQSTVVSQNQRLKRELQDAHSRVQELEQMLSAKTIENIQLLMENEDLLAALDLANTKERMNNDIYSRHAAQETELKEEIQRLKLELAELQAAHLKPISIHSPGQESTPELDSGLYYVCQHVDILQSSMCHATFNSPEVCGLTHCNSQYYSCHLQEVIDHALHEHYSELLTLI